MIIFYGLRPPIILNFKLILLRVWVCVCVQVQSHITPPPFPPRMKVGKSVRGGSTMTFSIFHLESVFQWAHTHASTAPRGGNFRKGERRNRYPATLHVSLPGTPHHRLSRHCGSGREKKAQQNAFAVKKRTTAALWPCVRVGKHTHTHRHTSVLFHFSHFLPAFRWHNDIFGLLWSRFGFFFRSPLPASQSAFSKLGNKCR